MITVKDYLHTLYHDILPVDKNFFVAHVLGVDVSNVIQHYDVVLSPSEYETLCAYCQRRMHQEPVDKIIGTKGFWEGDFFVSSSVLSPRPDTETLIESILDFVDTPPNRILDMGTGSGCLIISLLMIYKNASGVCVDISPDALDMAHKNAVHNGVENRLEYVHSDWWENIPKNFTFDLIVSNPPYIPRSDISNLSTEVKCHDPVLALDGGEDGLDAYRILANMPDGLLSENGCIVLEFGINQHAQVYGIFTNMGWVLKYQNTDISGIIRTQIFQKKTL